MVTVYITTNAQNEIESVNQSIEGMARFAYGLGVVRLKDEPCTYQSMVEHFEAHASADLATEDGTTYKVERHFVAA